MKLNIMSVMTIVLVNLWLTLSHEFDAPKTPLSEQERIEMKSILEASKQKFTTAIAELTDEQLAFKPNRKSWSIAECIEHITITELYFQEIVKEEMQKPAEPSKRKRIKITDGKIRDRMLSNRWKAKSPEIFKPDGNFGSTRETINIFQDARNQTINYVMTTKDDLRNHFWKHPLTGTIDLYQTLLLMSAHLERHTEQIERIKLSENYPNLELK